MPPEVYDEGLTEHLCVYFSLRNSWTRREGKFLCLVGEDSVPDCSVVGGG